jgi:hypothetical protein
MVHLILPEPDRYFSPLDETNFFTWIQRIPIVTGVQGGHGGLTIDLQTVELDDPSAQEFAALFARYKLKGESPGAPKSKTVPSKGKGNLESTILVEGKSKKFSLSIKPSLVSTLDGKGFDDWLKGIQPRYAGLDESKTAILELGSDDVTVGNFHELRAVFRRYDLDLSKLEPLRKISGYDQHWINWRKEVFGTP